MAGIGDSWGTKEELLHPRGPDGRWIRKGGIAKSIIARIMDALANFRPRMFQNQSQANQYLKNVASRKQSRFQGGRGYGRLLSDLGPTNEDLRDGVIDNPSTSRFVKMMDESATELPDDVILTRHVGVDAFGFTPQTATGTNSDTDPGIRGLSGKLIADRGYSTTTVGEPRGAPPQGSVRMVIAARKGTKVMVPGSGENDPVVFLDRDQPLRVTKIEPDGSGGWVMYTMTDEKKGPRETPVPIAGPIGAGTRDSKEREAAVADVERIRATREKRPDDTAEAADEAERRRKFEEAQGQDQVPSPQQEAERKRVEALQQQAGVQPRTEPIQARSIGGQPRPEGAPGGAPQAPAPGAPEATTPRRAVDLRLAVRDAGIPAPSAGPNRKRFNDAYEGIISGKKDPIDAVRELDRDAADLRAAGDADADNLEQLSDLIKREYGIEQRTGAGLPKVRKSQVQELSDREAARKAAKAGKATAPEAAPTPTPAKAPAKTPAKKAAGGMSRDQEDRVVARAREFRGNERNDEERRIVDTADAILAERSGTPAPAKMTAPAKKAAPAALTPEEEIKGLFGGKRPTNAQLREMGERNNLGFGSKEPRSEMILAILGARPRRGQQVGEVPAKAPAKKTQTKRLESQFRDNDLAPFVEEMRTPRGRQAEPIREVPPLPDELERRAKKAAPEAPGDDLDKMTKSELLALAKREGVQRTSSMNKEQLKAGIKRMRDLGPVESDSSVGRENRVQEIMGLDKKPTVAQLRAHAKEHRIQVGSGDRRDSLIEKILARNDRQDQVIEEIGANPEDFGRPAKKAAKAAVPGAAPGTAAGKITAGRIQPGMRVLVSRDAQNDRWVPSTRKTGQTTITIDRIDAVTGRGARSRRVLVGRDENGNEIHVASAPPHQTFIVAPEPGAAPAKKAAKAAAPKRMTIGEARRLSAVEAIRANEVTGSESNSWKTILSRVDGGDWTVARARKEAKDSARYWRESATTVRRGAGRSNPEKVEEAASRLERAADQYDKLAEDLTISQSVTKTDKFMRAGAPGAAPAPTSVPDIMARLNDFDNPPSREEATAMVAPLRRAQLMEIAKEIQLPGASKKTMPELKREIVEGTVGRRLDSIATRGFRGISPEQPDTPSKPDKVQVARARQEEIFEAKRFADTAAELDQLIVDDASDKAILSRFDNTVRREGVQGSALDVVRGHLAAGRRDEARLEMRRILDANGVAPTGNAGDIVPFDRLQHAEISGTSIGDGDMVRIVRPGHRATIRGEQVDLGRSVVEPATPDEVRTDARAKRLVPEGSVAGDRAQAPVSNEPRKRNFSEAWDAAELGAEGSPGRSMKEIRDDVASGKITPEEGIRRMEDEIAFNKEDLAEVDANLRQPDLSDEERDKLQTNAAVLTNGIEAQEKASKFLRLYFRNEEISAPEAKELVTLDLTGQDFKALQDASVDDLREAAKLGGLDPPKGNTKDDVLRDMVMQVARKVAQERGIAPKKSPAKKAAKAAKKAAPEVPKVTPERGKVDVRAIGSDLDVPEDILDSVQKDLDGGKMTPAQIGRELEIRAQRRRNSATIQHGSWGDSLRDMSDPDEVGRAEADRETHERLMRQADNIGVLADRLKKTRRPAVKKVAAKKAAPEVVQAEAKVDDLESRIINNAVADLEKAKTREQGNDALEGLTMPELRRLVDHLGIDRQRSKQGMRDSILDRFALPPAAIREAIAEPPRVAPVPLSRRARDAGIEPPARTFGGVDSGVSEADRRLKAGESPTTVSRFLRERAGQVAKADLNEEGRRFTTVQDKDTLRSIRKSSADYLRRVATHVQQEEKSQRPAKKAAPRPDQDLGRGVQLLARGTTREERAGTDLPSPSRTGTSPVGGTKSNAPEIPNRWGAMGTGGEVEFHPDGVVGNGIKDLGEDRLIDVDGEPLSAKLGRLVTRMNHGEISMDQLIDELNRLAQRLPEGSKARRIVEQMGPTLDTPKVKLDIPEGTPEVLSKLARAMADNPLARGAVDRPGFSRGAEGSELAKVMKMIEDFNAGRLAGVRFTQELQRIRSGVPHEANEGNAPILRALAEAVQTVKAIMDDPETRHLLARRALRASFLRS
jgi:hypothetical protein